MATPSTPDKSLLERLNALKPSSVSLAGPPPMPGVIQPRAGTVSGSAATHNSSDGTIGSGSGAPVSREDALAARLRTLRHEQYGAALDQSHVGAAGATTAGTEAAASVASASSPSHDRATPATEEGEAGAEVLGFGIDATDPLPTADEQALNDLLLELAAEGMGDEDADEGEQQQREGDSLVLLPLPDVPAGDHLEDSSQDDGGDEEKGSDAKQVEDLLRSLAGPKASLMQNDKEPGDRKKGNKPEEDDPDDSDGDDMGREIDDVLARAQTEAELERRNKTEAGAKQDDTTEEPGGNMERATRETEANDGDDGDGSPLQLPAVPTKLVDRPPNDKDEDGEEDSSDDISARLAALRGLRGKAAGLGHTDAFGLPSAPTFQPGDEGSVLKKGHFGHGRRNYTDADQETWCIVCMEDAAVRCLGCGEDDSENAYCLRCWRAMHVGPAAGFDERGHKRVPLVRRGDEGS